MKKSTFILIHIIFWLMYIVNSVIVYEKSYLDEYGYIDIGVKQFSIYILLIIVFYINYSFLIPKLLIKKKYLLYGLSFIGLIGLRYIFAYGNSLFLDWYFSSSTGFFVNHLKAQAPSFAFQTIFFLLVSTGARFTSDWFRHQEMQEEMERKKLDAELTMLKYQINPHFLFNTLNNIYSLINSKSAQAGEALLMLSAIMRYTLKEQQTDLIELDTEIDYMLNFINLQKLRLSNPEIIEHNIQCYNTGLLINPFLLIPFVENSFKHGDTTSSDAFIKINLKVVENQLFFNTSNLKSFKKIDEQSGIGIKNVKRRLEILYPKKHKLKIDETENNFDVELYIDFR